MLGHPGVWTSLTPKLGALPHYPPVPPHLLQVTRISAETTSLVGSVKPRLLGRVRVTARVRSHFDSGTASRTREPSREWISPSPQRGTMSPTSRRWRYRTERPRVGGAGEVNCGWGYECRKLRGVGLWEGMPFREGGCELLSLAGRGVFSHPPCGQDWSRGPGGAESVRGAQAYPAGFRQVYLFTCTILPPKGKPAGKWAWQI